MHLSSASLMGGGGTLGYMCLWGKWGLSWNFATNMSYYGGGNCGDIDLCCPTSRGKWWDFASSKARGDWDHVFSLD